MYISLLKVNIPSISDGDFQVIDFLIGRCRERHTVRSIAKQLKLSPAGVHVVFKKLEKHHIVQSEKLGSGLFYALNFSNPITHHLAAIALLSRTTSKQVTDDSAQAILATNSAHLSIGVSTSSSHLTPHQFIEKIQRKDPHVLALIKNGKAIKGETTIVKLIAQALFP